MKDCEEMYNQSDVIISIKRPPPEYIQKIGRMRRVQYKPEIMKKYTIKEFAEGKKAVKIENEEQWNKLNKVHKLTTSFYNPNLYTNQNTYNGSKQFYIDYGYEILEFSQLDFEDEFVAGSWCEYNGWFLKFQTVIGGNVFIVSETIDPNGIYENRENEGFTCGDADKTKVLLTDLSEIQQYLPPNHPDLMKKDTFVLPEYWRLKITPENKAIINEWKLKQKYNDDLFKYPEYTHVNSDGGGGTSTSFESENFITFEQFQQFVLKTTKTMEKEIKEYRVIEKYHNLAKSLFTECRPDNKGGYGRFDVDSNVKDFFKEAGVLDLWFEKVYKEQFKVDDWVELRGGGNGMMPDKRIICQLLEIDEAKNPSGHLQNKSHFMFKQGRGFYRTNKSHIVRLANPEEIKAQIQLPTINGYTGSYENGIIKYGCAEFTKMFFEHLNSTNSHLGNRTIKSIKLSSDVEISIEEIKQIVEYINKK